MAKTFELFGKYNFLLRQLVSRDFKIRYKRSVLGVLWSLLNPLLTMLVQYVVFSNLFRSFKVPHYQVYLLSGIVMFNFFSEATTQALNAITSNASLITKVYIPKYVFPLSKTLSACINLGFSVAALYVVLLFSGIRLHWAHLLLPFALVTLFFFTVGVGLILSALMVYFRDIQFLYGIVVMLWMYLTPIIYPMSILPEIMQRLMLLNPLYHYITYIRTIILDGAVPSLAEHAYCIAFAVFFLALGALVFKKLQNRFIFYI